MNIETANKLLELRKKHHYSQEDLAEKLGVSRQAVSKWERAEASPDTDNLILLARLYNVSLDELLNIDVKTFKKEKKEKTIRLTKPEDISQDEKTSPYIEENTGYQKFNPSSYMVSSIEEAQVRALPKLNFKVKSFDFLDSIADMLESFMAKHSLTYKGLYTFPYYAVALLMFFLSGHFISYELSWLWFLTIPLYYTTLKCIEKRNLYIFCYPIVCFMIFYLQIVFFQVGTSISWLWFLTIPLYYTLIPALKRDNPLIFCYPVLAVMLFFFFGHFFSYKLSLIFLATIPFYYWYFSKNA